MNLFFKALFLLSLIISHEMLIIKNSSDIQRKLFLKKKTYFRKNGFKRGLNIDPAPAPAPGGGPLGLTTPQIVLIVIIVILYLYITFKFEMYFFPFNLMSYGLMALFTRRRRRLVQLKGRKLEMQKKIDKKINQIVYKKFGLRAENFNPKILKKQTEFEQNKILHFLKKEHFNPKKDGKIDRYLRIIEKYLQIHHPEISYDLSEKIKETVKYFSKMNLSDFK